MIRDWFDRLKRAQRRFCFRSLDEIALGSEIPHVFLVDGDLQVEKTSRDIPIFGDVLHRYRSHPDCSRRACRITVKADVSES